MEGASWSAGLQVSNLGPKIKYPKSSESLPMMAKVGGSVDLPFSQMHRLMMTADLGYRLAPSDDDLCMNNAAFPGVVVGHAVPFICQLGSAAVSSCGNSGTARAALDDTDGDMTEIRTDRILLQHNHMLSFSVLLFPSFFPFSSR